MIENGTYPAYSAWRDNEADRAEDAANLFGAYLIQHCRAEAIKSVHAATSSEARQVVEEAVDAALHGVMHLLEGFWALPAGGGLRTEFALHVNVFEGEKRVESQAISPCKLDLPIGYWSWLEK